MDKTIQHINKLFESAKSQEPVISEDFVHTLLEKRALGSPDMYHIPKGVKFMNLISSIALASSTVCLLTIGQPQLVQNTDNTTIMSKQINKNNSSVQEEKKIFAYKNSIEEEKISIDEKNNSDKKAYTNNNNIKTDNESINNSNYFNSIDISGINPIKLTEAELEQIGFVIEKGGHISFYDEIPNSKVIFKNSVMSPWGLSTKQINISDLEYNEKCRVYPKFRFICDQDGNKRLSVFESGNSTTMVSKTQFIDTLPNIRTQLPSNKQYLLNNSANTKDFFKMQFYIQNSNDSKANDSINITKNIITSTSVSTNNSSFTLSPDNGEFGIFNINIPLSAFEDSLKNIDPQIIKDLSNTTTSIIMKLFQNDDGSLSDNLSTDIDSLENNINLNELLPIEVDLKDDNGNPYIKNGEQQTFIIWFEPTIDFISQLPDAVKSKLSPELEAIPDSYESCPQPPLTGERPHFDVWRACSGAIENLKVYPIPAKDFLTYKYNLSQDRNISIYICNLNGEIIANPLSNVNVNSTCVEERIDVGFLKPGMYLIVVASDSGEKAVQRFIVQ